MREILGLNGGPCEKDTWEAPAGGMRGACKQIPVRGGC